MKEYKGLLIERIEGDLAITHKGYVFDRRIFRAFTITLVLLIILVMSVEGIGFEKIEYFECPITEQLGCTNPFYHACTHDYCRAWEEMPVLPSGTLVGKKPGTLFNWFFVMCACAFMTFFIINHLVHNKGKKFSDILNVEVEE